MMLTAGYAGSTQVVFRSIVRKEYTRAAVKLLQDNGLLSRKPEWVFAGLLMFRPAVGKKKETHNRLEISVKRCCPHLISIQADS